MYFFGLVILASTFSHGMGFLDSIFNSEIAANCKKDSFLCRNGRCISEKKRCDDVNDCFDSSDEQDCGKSTLKSSNEIIYR